MLSLTNSTPKLGAGMEANPEISHTNESDRHQHECSSTKYYSPLPPCPDDPPAPPPPSCTPPKYHSCALDDEDLSHINGHSSEFGTSREAENCQNEDLYHDRVDEPSNSLPPPPSPMQTVCSPVVPPPPPFPPSPSSGIEDDEADRNSMYQGVRNHTKVNETQLSDSEAKSILIKSPLNTVALMRREASLRGVLGVNENQVEQPTEKQRWYMGDIDDYTIIDKVGSGTYGYVVIISLCCEMCSNFFCMQRSIQMSAQSDETDCCPQKASTRC